MPHKPKPFKRPSIELGTHGRTWQDLHPLRLRPGDIVAGKGQVAAVVEDEFISVTFLSGEVETYDESSSKVFVFARAVVDE